VCKNLQITRQSTYKAKGSVTHMKNYKKEDDKIFLPKIKSILEKRPSYGYKRITAMLNATQVKENNALVNKKRVYRIMKVNGLLLPKSQNLREPHNKTGKIITLHSNTRWCSDGFEIRCFNDEKVYVAFSLDCKDREAISYVASKTPLTGKDIQELMIKSVEHRFGKLSTPRLIEWLTDRGSIYRDKQVRNLAKNLGLKTCYTAPYSPSSNGMAEAFVGTFKRDYVYVNDCYSADLVLEHLNEWFYDYNYYVPHSGLAMMSPKQYQNSL
jgi:putative transposase